MKKILSFIMAFSIVSFVVLTPVIIAHAATNKTTSGSNKTSGGAGIINPLEGTNDDLPTFVKNLLKIVFQVGTMIAVFFIIYAGFKYVVAQGDPGKLKEAHAMLLWAAIGTAILLGAQVIADVIQNTVTQLGAK